MADGFSPASERSTMKKLAVVIWSTIALCGCNAAKQVTPAPQAQPIPIAQTWAISIANSSSAPAGWISVLQTIKAQTVPVTPCATEFSTLASPNTIPIPAFQACADVGGIPLPQGQSNWFDTVVLGITTTELYNGETVSYILRNSSADGSTTTVLGGTGAFSATTTTSGNGTTTFNYQITGPINCLTINSSITAGCTAWQTTFTANLN
jgi:hypothetical protein